MVELWAEMWEFHRTRDPRFEGSPFAREFMARWFEDHVDSDQTIMLVAEEGGRGVGYLMGFIVENPPVVPERLYGHVSEVAVEARARRRGVGKALLDEAHRRFRSRGCAYMEAFVSTANPVAGAFWRKEGYREFIERLRYDFDGPRA